jgi:hypothetical protein
MSQVVCVLPAYHRSRRVIIKKLLHAYNRLYLDPLPCNILINPVFQEDYCLAIYFSVGLLFVVKPLSRLLGTVASLNDKYSS